MIITLGARGVYYSSDKQNGEVPAIKVDKVVDTTAAGDTFVGHFAVALARSVGTKAEFDIRHAIQTANAAAALTVQKAGAQPSIPWGYEL